MRSCARRRHVSPRRSSTADRNDGAFIDALGQAHGVEPLCSVLPIAPSTAYEQRARRADPERLSEGASGALDAEYGPARRYSRQKMQGHRTGRGCVTHVVPHSFTSVPSQRTTHTPNYL